MTIIDDFSASFAPKAWFRFQKRAQTVSETASGNQLSRSAILAACKDSSLSLDEVIGHPIYNKHLPFFMQRRLLFC